MKKILYYLFFLLIGVGGCEVESEFLFVTSTDDIFFTGEGAIVDSHSSKTVKIWVSTTVDSRDLKIYSDQEWCSLSALKAHTYFTITASPNVEDVARIATVTIAAKGTPSVYIKVHQSARCLFEITPSTPQDISDKGGTVSVSIKSNVSWTASSKEAWAVVDTKSGIGDGSTQIFIDPNPNMEADEATIFFNAENKHTQLIINRAANPNGPYIAITPSANQRMPVSGGEFVVSISSNTSWTASSSKAWATVETKTGVGNGSTLISLAANTGYGPKTATIFFRAGTAYKEIKIEQESASNNKHIREGYSGPVVYTVDDEYVREGYSGSVVYVIDDVYIREYYSGPIVYAIDGEHIRDGYSGYVVYTIDGKYIREGYSGSVAYSIE